MMENYYSANKIKITILGASGFIGSHLVTQLREEQINYWAPDREDPTIYKRSLGHVIYCIGLTADFRTRPFDTVNAHVCLLLKVLKQCKFDSFLYLSSTRMYGAGQGIAREEDPLKIHPLDFNDLYNISKAMGESICFATGKDTVRVVRLSNVYGSDFKSENFISSLIRDALRYNKMVLHTSLDSGKDYINIKDAVNILPKIAMHGSHKIYNVASGKNTTNDQIVNIISRLTGSIVEVDKNAKRIGYPTIDISQIKEEFAFSPAMITNDLNELVSKYNDFMKEEK